MVRRGAGGRLRAVVLSAYPLSRTFRERLEPSLGRPIEYLDLAKLRARGVRSSIRMLRAHAGGNWSLALEDETTAALMPFLAASAALAQPASLEVVRGDLSRSRLSPLAALRATVALGGASLRGWSALRAARGELAALRVAEPLRAESLAGGRTLFVYANLWFGLKAGGSVGHVAGVVNGLSDAGLGVDLATSIEPVLIKQTVRVIRLRPPDVLGLPFEANHYRFQRDVLEQLRGAPGGSYALIYYRMSVANYLGVTLSRALGVPLVAEYNGSEVWAARNWGRPLRYEQLAREAEDVTFRHAHVVVVVSETLRAEVIARGVRPDRVAFHPNGVDLTLFSPDRFDRPAREAQRRALGIAADATVVTFVGTFGRWHGVDVLARAIRRLVDDERAWLERARVRFLLVGDGLKMPEVRSLLGDRVDPFVLLTGLVPQADAPQYLAASDVLVSPHVPNADGSAFFGSPTKLFEYMAMARGIVASDLGQIGEVLQPALRVGALPSAEPTEPEGRVAVLARPGDVDELIEGIRFLVERPRWRSVLGANARRRALSRYSWRSHVETILERVRGVIGEPS